MDLEGDLSVFDPLSVFQLMNLARCSGELNVDVMYNSARIYFDRGSITFAELSNSPARLGDYLVQQQLIGKRKLEKIVNNTPEGKKLGDLLIQQGVIGEDELHNALKEQIKDVIYEVVKWRRGWFSFIRGQEPKSRDVLIDIPLDHLMLEGLKRMDEEGS